MSGLRHVDFIAGMEAAAPVFERFGLAHLVVILLTIALPFVMATAVRKSRWPRSERTIGKVIAILLGLNYLGYALYLRSTQEMTWQTELPFQLCDWAMIAIVVALLTGRERWLEVAYFWGLGGTLQAIITPDLRHAFPDVRFFSFFIGHSGIVVGILFLMIVRGYRPHFSSIWRTFAWSEVYFVVTIVVDLITGVNYGYLLHKPQEASLLSFLSDNWPIYLLQMHLLALAFFCALYVPFAIYDLFKGKKVDA
ncbi:MAG TPA: TIGR02206 family membrane protein [Chthoniobacterales bacterium]|nr:TIGR02206 family membrane protein [Chthoniobacterales bacterium]